VISDLSIHSNDIKQLEEGVFGVVKVKLTMDMDVYCTKSPNSLCVGSSGQLQTYCNDLD
jgi:hypothetical protein